MSLPPAEFGIQECGHQFDSQGWSHNPGTKRQDVNIVMLHRLVRRIGVVAQAGSHPFQFISGNRSANARSANQDASIDLPALDRSAQLLSVIRVVDRVGRVRAQVDLLMPTFADRPQYGLLERITGVVASHPDPHFLASSTLSFSRTCIAAATIPSAVRPKFLYISS